MMKYVIYTITIGSGRADHAVSVLYRQRTEEMYCIKQLHLDTCTLHIHRHGHEILFYKFNIIFPPNLLDISTDI